MPLLSGVPANGRLRLRFGVFALRLFQRSAIAWPHRLLLRTVGPFSVYRRAEKTEKPEHHSKNCDAPGPVQVDERDLTGQKSGFQVGMLGKMSWALNSTSLYAISKWQWLPVDWPVEPT